jgi:hypothetical protein
MSYNHEIVLLFHQFTATARYPKSWQERVWHLIHYRLVRWRWRHPVRKWLYRTCWEKGRRIEISICCINSIELPFVLTRRVSHLASLYLPSLERIGSHWCWVQLHFYKWDIVYADIILVSRSSTHTHRWPCWDIQDDAWAQSFHPQT